MKITVSKSQWVKMGQQEKYSTPNKNIELYSLLANFGKNVRDMIPGCKTKLTDSSLEGTFPENFFNDKPELLSSLKQSIQGLCTAYVKLRSFWPSDNTFIIKII